MDGKLFYLADKDEYIFITSMALDKKTKDIVEADMSSRLNAKAVVIGSCSKFEYIGREKSNRIDNPVKDFDTPITVDAKPLLAKPKEIKAEMSTKIEGVALPDHASVPHVRIEFDDINGVPCVWVDGKRIDRSDTGLVSVSLDWHTKDPAATDHVIRAYKIEYLKGDHREGIAQGSAMGPDLFKNDIDAK